MWKVWKINFKIMHSCIRQASKGTFAVSGAEPGASAARRVTRIYAGAMYTCLIGSSFFRA